jgi:hypothetical protein
MWVISLSASVASLAEARELVLVSSISSDYTPLTRHEVRKVFLGYPVKKDNKEIYAIRNISDNKTYEIFLQKLIGLSAKGYERRLLLNTFHSGSPRVSSEDSLQELVTILHDDKAIVTFMWLDEVESLSEIKVIQTLWEDNAP